MRAAIVLAAGASRRFGRLDKLQTRLQGQSLLDLAVANARASGASRIIIVTSRPVRLSNVTAVRTKDARNGMSASLAAGLAALRPIEREVMIFLADMPFARTTRRMRLMDGIDAVRPRHAGVPGHPVLARAAAARAGWIRGDEGLGAALPAVFVRGNAGNIIDIDTQAALRRARRHGSRAFGRRPSFA